MDGAPVPGDHDGVRMLVAKGDSERGFSDGFLVPRGGPAHGCVLTASAGFSLLTSKPIANGRSVLRHVMDAAKLRLDR